MRISEYAKSLPADSRKGCKRIWRTINHADAVTRQFESDQRMTLNDSAAELARDEYWWQQRHDSAAELARDEYWWQQRHDAYQDEERTTGVPVCALCLEGEIDGDPFVSVPNEDVFIHFACDSSLNTATQFAN